MLNNAQLLTISAWANNYHAALLVVIWEPFGSRSGAIPLGSRSGAVRAGFDDLYLVRMILAILFDRSPAL